MVRGLDVFQGWFADYADQYVLIGGTAASLDHGGGRAGVPRHQRPRYRPARRGADAAFGEAFWKFVDDGGYEIRQASDTGKPIFYRFQKPADDRYPAMVELFARAPDGFQPAEGSQLTPIPLDEAVSSLSAILLDESYYAFIMAGRREVDGLPWVGEDRLIPLKAIAWLDLTRGKSRAPRWTPRTCASISTMCCACRNCWRPRRAFRSTKKSAMT
jgi:hypothetical protein